MDVWKCHFGYEGDCTKKLPCKDRCLNGGHVNCDDNEPCPCPNEFRGEFCEHPSPCHEGNQPETENSITLLFLGYCDPETKTCIKDSEGKPMCVWKDGYNSSFKTVSSAVLLIQILFLAF